ncbi:MAG: pantoate--beta-alanine ligase [Acidobacteriales bacterium]|nr:pantoate--beta-alanine ligase [Terriglobales bacterium]
MEILRTAADMRAACRALTSSGMHLGLVPTMGALHHGHLSLVEAAQKQCDEVAVSIFVNPTQFGPNEDFSKYPRNFPKDSELLRLAGVRLLFAPSVDEMYPDGALTHVTVEGLSQKLCGKSRPGHFRGVTTVVAKLFNIMQPQSAFFGQKDAAQVAIIRRMTRDLNTPVQIIVCPIVREPDGLAMSSRNAYLNTGERQSALVLYRALTYVQTLFSQGERNAERLITEGSWIVKEEPSVHLDYFAVVDPETLDPVENASAGVLVAVAAIVGGTRLIDNIVLMA